MSDYHILAQSIDKKTIQVALHYTIPANSQNKVSKYHRDLIVIVRKDQATGMVESQVPYLADEFATELAQLRSGEKLEEIISYRFSSLNLSVAEKRAEIEALWSARQTEIFDELQKQLEYYHYDNDIV